MLKCRSPGNPPETDVAQPAGPVLARDDGVQQVAGRADGVLAGLGRQRVYHGGAHEPDPSCNSGVIGIIAPRVFASRDTLGEPGRPVLDLEGVDDKADALEGVSHPGGRGEEPGAGVSGLLQRQAMEHERSQQGSVDLRDVAMAAHFEDKDATGPEAVEDGLQDGDSGAGVSQDPVQRCVGHSINRQPNTSHHNTRIRRIVCRSYTLSQEPSTMSVCPSSLQSSTRKAAGDEDPASRARAASTMAGDESSPSTAPTAETNLAVNWPSPQPTSSTLSSRRGCSSCSTVSASRGTKAAAASYAWLYIISSASSTAHHAGRSPYLAPLRTSCPFLLPASVYPLCLSVSSLCLLLVCVSVTARRRHQARRPRSACSHRAAKVAKGAARDRRSIEAAVDAPSGREREREGEREKRAGDGRAAEEVLAKMEETKMPAREVGRQSAFNQNNIDIYVHLRNLESTSDIDIDSKISTAYRPIDVHGLRARASRLINRRPTEDWKTEISALLCCCSVFFYSILNASWSPQTDEATTATATSRRSMTNMTIGSIAMSSRRAVSPSRRCQSCQKPSRWRPSTSQTAQTLRILRIP